MRGIQVSTEVYAAIWAARAAGEENEDAILRRVLNAAPTTTLEESAPISGSGVTDGRSGVHFSEGTQIFRNYKGRRYMAVARSGYWIREDNTQPYSSLNRLNSSIVAGSENVWNGNWKLQHTNGKVVSINALRS